MPFDNDVGNVTSSQKIKANRTQQGLEEHLKENLKFSFRCSQQEQKSI